MSECNDLLEEAIGWALDAHSGQVDKEGKPYILHCLRVMLDGMNWKEMVVGILHDIVEDTNVSLELLANCFDEPITEAIDAITRREEESYPDYIRRCGKNPLARQVKLYDLDDNLDPSRASGTTPEMDTRHREAREYLLGFTMKPFPLWGAWLNYPLSKGAAFLKEIGWELKAHGVVIGPIAFCVLWRVRVPPAERYRNML